MITTENALSKFNVLYILNIYNKNYSTYSTKLSKKTMMYLFLEETLQIFNICRNINKLCTFLAPCVSCIYQPEPSIKYTNNGVLNSKHRI